MPVYNGIQFLNKTVESVLNQSFKYFELICIDDSSTDGSYQLLQNYSKRDSRIRLYQKPNGGSVPKSWNYALSLFNGDFIMYLSQDDLMSKDNLEKLIIRQIETNADCVLPDMIFYSEGKVNTSGRFGVAGNREVVLDNKEAVVLSLNWEIHGFALWKSELFKNEKFPEDSFDSDEYMVRKLFFKSNKVVFCHGVFYYRQDNENAITKTFGFKNYFSILKEYKIYKLLLDNNFNEEIVNFKLYDIYKIFIQLYKFHLNNKGLKSRDSYMKVHTFLRDFYFSNINYKAKLKFSQKEYFKKKDFFLISILTYSFTLFKFLMIIFVFKNKLKTPR